MKNDKFAVIMAGGVGSRFWPVSRQSFPKQFHDMLGQGKSLLQMTFDRLSRQVPVSQIFVLTNMDYVDLVQEQLPQIKSNQIVAEPAMRNTAPCILLAALKIQKINPEASIVVAPSDHYIPDQEMFERDLDTAFGFCQKHPSALLTLGIKPISANTGYGYIEYDSSGDVVKKVSQFREKPDLETAESFLMAGNFLWNAGIFVWKAAAVVAAFAKAQPKMSMLFATGLPKLNTEFEKDWLATHYTEADNISVDYAIMEESDQVYVLPAQFIWNDLGTWGSLYQQLDKNQSDNAIVNASVTQISSQGNMIRTTEGKKVIVQGLQDMIVVEEDDILMIIPKSAEQDIKQIRNQAMEKYGDAIG
ncbi:mannose-1-phosphate guanylyltransferase [Nonlabens xiamenensis]|uniref:mannose-1-phosphate guanylyltransferase n=1 Tax=Nonlabens xiamenensis TaxID=2341043 RepID=UPI000F6068BC|nr:mannose-1-phosphate guanylyltransferase [Nonlabens xiamenensis]